MPPGSHLWLAHSTLVSFIRVASDACASGGPRLKSHALTQCERQRAGMTSLPSVGILIFAHSTFTACLLWGPDSVKSHPCHQGTFNLERMADSKK